MKKEQPGVLMLRSGTKNRKYWATSFSMLSSVRNAGLVQTSPLKASRPGSESGEEKWICGKKSFPWCDWKSSRTKRSDSPEPHHPLCPLCHSWLVNRNFVSGPESAHWGVGTPHTSRNTPHTTSLPRLHFLSSSPISFQTGPVLAWRINRFTRPLTN